MAVSAAFFPQCPRPPSIGCLCQAHCPHWHRLCARCTPLLEGRANKGGQFSQYVTPVWLLVVDQQCTAMFWLHTSETLTCPLMRAHAKNFACRLRQ